MVRVHSGLPFQKSPSVFTHNKVAKLRSALVPIVVPPDPMGGLGRQRESDLIGPAYRLGHDHALVDADARRKLLTSGLHVE